MSRLKPRPPIPRAVSSASPPRKWRVLFLCLGNSCRSQMAEGFARRYGADVLDAASAGLSPLSYVAPLTIETMKQHGIDISDQYPKAIDEAPFRPWDIVVNMSGLPLPFPLPGQLLTWPVRDPFTLPPSVYQQVARDIESRVQALLLNLRRQPPP